MNSISFILINMQKGNASGRWISVKNNFLNILCYNNFMSLNLWPYTTVMN